MNISKILYRPLITEKTTTHLGGGRTYAFEVAPAANKQQVRAAIQMVYGVAVADVRTVVVRGKVKRFGRGAGKRRNWKKAYVTVVEGAQLNIFEG